MKSKKEIFITWCTLPHTVQERIIGWLIAARSGHDHFSSAHTMKNSGMKVLRVCGQKRAQLRPFSCAHAREHRSHLWVNYGAKSYRHLRKAVPPVLQGVWYDWRRGRLMRIQLVETSPRWYTGQQLRSSFFSAPPKLGTSEGGWYI